MRPDMRSAVNDIPNCIFLRVWDRTIRVYPDGPVRRDICQLKVFRSFKKCGVVAGYVLFYIGAHQVGFRNGRRLCCS